MLESAASPVRNTLAFEANVCGEISRQGGGFCTSAHVPACCLRAEHICETWLLGMFQVLYYMHRPKGYAVLFSVSYPKNNSLYLLPIEEGG